MVEVGERPILWHIMKIYAAHGINEFIICLGYKGYMIKDYFYNYTLHHSDVTFDLRNNKKIIHQNATEPWTVTLVDTGENSMTGGRIKRVKDYVGNETFCMTYGDGVSDLNIKELIDFHRIHKTLATLAAVKPPGRFGAFTLNESQDKILSFREKPEGDGAWVNGGFFVLEPEVFDLIEDDHTVWEREPLERLAEMEMLSAYKYDGFWQPMDTLRDKKYLDACWKNGKAPWRVWE
jgi:glucose-1-phosphate cytidylyltransferase